jgi:hypothetical protein
MGIHSNMLFIKNIGYGVRDRFYKYYLFVLIFIIVFLFYYIVMKWNATKQSEKITSFFLKNNCIKHIEHTDTETNLITLYTNMVEATNWIKLEKGKGIDVFYNLKMKDIKIATDIPMPTDFGDNKFVGKEVFEHIQLKSVFNSTYTINVLDKQVVIHFVFEKEELNLKWNEPHIETINSYVDNIIMWFHVASRYSTQPCSKKITIYIYLSSLTKNVPELPDVIIAPIHVNTGVTHSCPVQNGEIVIYRHEEWFKVLVHESFHALGLDFSAMNTAVSETNLRELFHIPTQILLFEAYAEFWARTINALIISFRWANGKSDEFITNAIFLLDYERVYSFFQMVKVLEHMQLNYVQLYTDPTLLQKYKEETNVFVYYVITTILMNNYPQFMKWCKENNTNLLQFNMTEEHQMLFCNYIKTFFNTPEMIMGINCTNKLFKKLKVNSKKAGFILETLRMSLCEIKYL